MTKKDKHQIKRAHLNAAMEEYFARGGRIKKMNGNYLDNNINPRQFELEDELFADFSTIEVSCDVPIKGGFKLKD